MFDKKRCVDNIYALAKAKGLKIGDIEEKAGVSKGYLSRINKEDSTSIPAIDMMASIAEQLGVGIDYLVNFPIGKITPNEEFVYQFIEKLISATLNGQMEWVAEAKGILTAESSDPVKNPLVSVTKDYSDDAEVWYDVHTYTSGIYSDAPSWIIGDCFYANLPMTRATVYLNSVRYEIPRNNDKFSCSTTCNAIEVYLVTDTLKPICSTYFVCDEIKKVVTDLYTTVASSPSRIGLDYSTKSIMKSFMKGVMSIETKEDNPF